MLSLLKDVLASLLLCFSFMTVCLAQNSSTNCDPDDYKFEFTECDSLGGRWRVSVPTNPYKCSGSPPPTNPVRVNACFSSCSNGQFYNLKTLLCEDCPLGHYSLGGGIIIDNFNVSNRLPRGFHIITESTSSSLQSLTSSFSSLSASPGITNKASTTKKKQLNRQMFQDDEDLNNSTHCPTWRVDLNSKQLVITSLLSSPPTSDSSPTGSGCISALTYTVRIVKSGRLSFSYRYLVGDELLSSLLFTFHYKLYGEGTVLEDGRHTSGSIRFPAPSLDQGFDTVDIDLSRPGLYVFTWKAVIIGSTFRQFSSWDSSGSFSPFSTQASVGSIKIKKIQIEGVAYASECTPCEPGLFANVSGSQQCLPCPRNTFSPSYEAVSCQECDSRTEYSYPGSVSCKKRPICGRNDLYSSLIGTCDPKTGRRPLEFKWIEPKICMDVENIIQKQPKSVDCKEADTKNQTNNEFCDPGMEYRPFKKLGKLCQFCSFENYYRSGSESDKCIPCPPFTTPIYALSIHRWNVSLPGWGFAQEFSPDYESTSTFLTSFFSRQCLKPDMDESVIGECDAHNSWQPFEEYIRTGPSASLDAYLILSISLTSGFRSLSGGEISFVFETFCDFGDQCSLLFVETHNDDTDFDSGTFSSSPAFPGKNSLSNNPNRKSQNLLSSQNNIIHEWLDSTENVKSFRHRIVGNISISYSFVFKRSKSYQSFARIHSLYVTNPIGAPAIECRKCDEDARKCLTCPKNQYLELKNTSSASKSTPTLEDYICLDCPSGTVTEFGSSTYDASNPKDTPHLGVAACLSCGENLISTPGEGCFSDCSVNFENGDQFDLSALSSQSSSSLLFHGSNLFTAGGTQYQHLFNLHLCGASSHSTEMATCMNNITEDTTGVRSFICRSTLIPEASQIFSTQAISLGDELVGISRSSAYRNISVYPEFIQANSQHYRSAKLSNSDFHLFFSTKTPTAACVRGRRMTLTMRCNHELEKERPGSVQISAPKACPDGTCDGCNFHLLIESGTSATCRICREFSALDFEEVPGECIDNRQVVHYLNPQNCVPKKGSKTFRIQDCTVELPRQVQIGIAMSILIAMILLFLVLHFWTRNRSLEYKYSRLVEGGNDKGNEEDEVGIDNCCVEEIEDDEDDDNDSGRTNQNNQADNVPGISFSNVLFDDRKNSPKNGLNKAPKSSPKSGSPRMDGNSNKNRLGNDRQAFGSKKEMQGLFSSSSPEHANRQDCHEMVNSKGIFDNEGYETIHLTSAGHAFGQDSNQLV